MNRTLDKIMSLDFSNLLRDDAQSHARRRLRRDHVAAVPAASARAQRLRRLAARVRFAVPGAVTLVADVVMVSVAAAVALVAVQSITP